MNNGLGLHPTECSGTQKSSFHGSTPARMIFGVLMYVDAGRDNENEPGAQTLCELWCRRLSGQRSFLLPRPYRSRRNQNLSLLWIARSTTARFRLIPCVAAHASKCDKELDRFRRTCAIFAPVFDFRYVTVFDFS